MRIALASSRVALTVDAVRQSVVEAAIRGTRVVCFPEAYVPGLHGVGVEVPAYDRADQERVVEAVGGWAREHWGRLACPGGGGGSG